MRNNENLTVEKAREMAQQCRDERARSWEDSDSDGFLSQWANQQMAHRYDGAAKVLEAGGTVEFRAVFNLAGEQVEAEESKGEYGMYWFIRSAEGKARYFSESNAASEKVRVKNNAKKGYYLGTVRHAVSFDSMAEMKVGELVEVVDNGQEALAQHGLI